MEDYDDNNIVNVKEEADINLNRKDENNIFDRLSRLQKLIKKESYLRQLGKS